MQGRRSVFLSLGIETSGKRLLGVVVWARGGAHYNFYKCALKLQENPLLSIKIYLVLDRVG